MKSFTRLLLTGFLLLAGIYSSACAQEYEYKPEFQKVIYRSVPPATIQRITKKVGRTRFFGSVQMGKQSYAVHFYDTDRVQPDGQYYKRNSCVDIFQLTATKVWKRIQTFPLTREVGVKRDRLTVEVQALWLNPSLKTTPMIYLQIMENDDRSQVPIGNRTYGYGVLQTQANMNLFKKFDCYMPYSNSTVTLSEISYPDAQGNLTLLHITSDPGETGTSAYGWSGKSWITVATSVSQNGYETAKVWNGTQFVPLSSFEKKP